MAQYIFSAQGLPQFRAPERITLSGQGNLKKN
jgi:hypothetical protein